MVLANVDPFIGFLYRAGGRLLFTRPVAALLATVAAVGLVAFGWQWWAGEQSVFLTSRLVRHRRRRPARSERDGAGLPRARARAGHQARRPAGAGGRVPGLLRHPVVFVDTTDVWMAGPAGPPAHHRGRSGGRARARRRLRAGRLGRTRRRAPWCFKLSFAWYINAMFNLNPFLALDGYYLRDGLAGGAQPARARAVLGGRAVAAPAAALAGAWTGRAAWSRCTGCSPWLAADRRQHRLPGLRRPGRRTGRRLVADRLAGPGACCSRSSRR